MEQNWTRALKGSISDAFSTMFFMVPDEDPDLKEKIYSEPAAGWIEGWAEVTRQDRKVRLWVWSTSDLAGELAGNILSADPAGISPEEVLDAYREMINIVVGSLLTKVDKESQWNMSLPQSERLNTGTMAETLAKAQELFFYDLEGSPLAAGWKSF